ncbi:MAG: hypothetical protein R2910_12360 [Gemmatimonadales bacterium]
MTCLHLLLPGGLEAQTATAGSSEFVLVERARLPEANAGIVQRYQRADGAEVLLFVTPLPPSLDPCVDACAERAVDTLSANFAQALIDESRRPGHDKLTIAGSTVVAPPPTSWLERGRLTALRRLHDGHLVDSYLWLFLGRETLVQVRGAEPAGSIDFATLERLVSTLVLTIPPPYDCPDGVISDSALVAVWPMYVPMHRLPFLVDSTLAAREYHFAYRSEDAGLWRTTPRFAWPSGSALALASEDVRPGIELVVMTAVGDNASLVAISSRPVCQLPETGGRTGEDVMRLARQAMVDTLDAILDAVGYVR